MLSAIIALTLSPALVRGVPAPHRPPAWADRLDADGIDKVRDGYSAVVSVCCGWPSCPWSSSRHRRSASSCSARSRRPASCPRRTRAPIFTVGAVARRRLGRAARATVVEQVENLIRPMPQVEAVLSIVGFSLLDGGNQPNAAFIVVRLKPFEDRTGPPMASRRVLGQIFGAAQQIRSAVVFPFNLPPIIGLSTSGGFEYQLENLEGRPTGRNGERDAGPGRRRQPGPAADARVLDLHRLQPLDLARYRPREGPGAGIVDRDVFNALQSDAWWILRQRLQLFGRTWQVNIQAEALDRSDPAAIYKIYVRNRGRDGAVALDRQVRIRSARR